MREEFQHLTQGTATEASTSGAKRPRGADSGSIPRRQLPRPRSSHLVSTGPTSSLGAPTRIFTPTCFYCQQPGHKIAECPQYQTWKSSQTQRRSQGFDIITLERDQVTCFQCGQTGHVRRTCPRLLVSQFGSETRPSQPYQFGTVVPAACTAMPSQPVQISRAPQRFGTAHQSQTQVDQVVQDRGYMMTDQGLSSALAVGEPSDETPDL